VLFIGKEQGFIVAQTQDAERTKTFIKKVVHSVLEALIKIDQHIPAENQLEFIERMVRC
jgi:hypothetical protein